ncbi:MAG: DUF2283 domain-containing protein [Candidatus Electryonea clarkiae]|nr:DUF2283 domain-containing protein [Candidatus Electryonea clarkiae]MDP8288566.1 DUF2283 domain-containing protein [Candidatus Electryonea clarkiae]
MKIKYFKNTDTTIFEFSDRDIFETKDINENINIDLDNDGNLISMTVEHAREQVTIKEFSYQEIEKSEAA